MIAIVFMDDIDYVANHVGAFCLTGLFSGAAYAKFKAFPTRRISLRAGASCACVATTLFVFERIANISLRKESDANDSRISCNDVDIRTTLSSHAFGGAFGGGLNGYLYHKQPIRGMVLFTPLMLCLGAMKLEYKRRKQKRESELLYNG